MAATIHNGNDVVNGVSWFTAVVARWFALQDDCAVAPVFARLVFFTHCQRVLGVRRFLYRVYTNLYPQMFSLHGSYDIPVDT